MAAKRRKPGDWKAVANQRAKRERENRTGRGLTNIPSLSDVGSAAYRRQQAKLNTKWSHKG